MPKKKTASDIKKRVGKFFILPKELAARRDLTLAAKAVWSVLDDYRRYAERKGYRTINPGIRRLTEDLGCSNRVVYKGINCLSERGMLKVIQGVGTRCNTYELADSSVPKEHKQETLALLRNTSAPKEHKTPRSVPKERTKTINQEQTKTIPAAPVRKRNEVWDTLSDVFDFQPVTKTEKSRFGKAVRDLTEHGATEHEIRKRYNNYKANWPNVTCTLEAFVKHWQQHAKLESNNHSSPARTKNTGAIYDDKSTKIA